MQVLSVVPQGSVLSLPNLLMESVTSSHSSKLNLFADGVLFSHIISTQDYIAIQKDIWHHGRVIWWVLLFQSTLLKWFLLLVEFSFYFWKYAAFLTVTLRLLPFFAFFSFSSSPPHPNKKLFSCSTRTFGISDTSYFTIVVDNSQLDVSSVEFPFSFCRSTWGKDGSSNHPQLTTSDLALVRSRSRARVL